MLEAIQAHLEAIYGVRSEARASAFVVGSEQARALGATGRSDEELLVAEGEDGLELGLCFSPGLFERAAGWSDAASAIDRDLDGYCQLTEGVSHFLYLVNAAGQDRTLSLLELEAQAEVDKFASAVLHGWDRGAVWARALAGRLFDQVRYRATLTEGERWRYREANRLAKNYCQRLFPLFAARRLEALLRELRHSYRLGAEAKLQYLAAPAR